MAPPNTMKPSFETPSPMARSIPWIGNGVNVSSSE